MSTTAANFRRAGELFQAAAKLDPEARERFIIEQSSGDVELLAHLRALLRADQLAKGVLDQPALGAGLSLAAVETAALAAGELPERIGRYRIVRVIGEGGMGIVYEAEQENPRRSVALKVLRTNASLGGRHRLQRFQQEAQILGRLQHPGIAQILEAGTTEAGDGAQPFFVMEYVHGKPLLNHAREHKLSVRERLDLMALICDAVHYAHQSGVVHRDLKPGNILVIEPGAASDDRRKADLDHGGDRTDPGLHRSSVRSSAPAPVQPKILDFGVARLTDADIQAVTLHTSVGELIGTVPYMSPEQAAGDPSDLDWRSDVYSLGVILYEMLTGQLPQDVRNLMVHEAVRVIREDDPTPAGSIDRSLRGDVETVLAKALEKDKTRRYQSAADLGADIRRYLHEQPIAARPASALYRMRKFARRNKAIVSGVTIAFAAMTVATAASVRQAIVAEKARRDEHSLRTIADKQRADAESAREEAQAVSTFLAEMLGAPDPDEMGKDVRVIDVLEHAAAQIDQRFPDKPAVRCHLHRNIGITYRRLGMLGEAEVQLAAAVANAQAAYDRDHPALLRALRSLAVLYDDQGRYEKSVPMHEEVLAIQTRTLGPRHRDTLGTACNLGLTLHDLERDDEAERVLEPTLAIMRETLGTADRFTINCLQGLGTVWQRQGRLEEAATAFEEARDASSQAFGRSDMRAITALTSLVEVQLEREQPAQALALADDAMERARSALPADHWHVGRILHVRGQSLARLERVDEAEESLQAAHKIFLATFGPSDGRTTSVVADLAKIEGARQGQ